MASTEQAEARRLGRRLRDLRIRFELRQDDVAELIGTDAGSVSRIENGKREPSIRQLRKLARRFGLSPGRLLDGPENRRSRRSSRPVAKHEGSISQPQQQ
jgi:transcriptional regulator with XRE-family HTH domain